MNVFSVFTIQVENDTIYKHLCEESLNYVNIPKRFVNFIFLTGRRHYGNSIVVSLNGIILEGGETSLKLK